MPLSPFNLNLVRIVWNVLFGAGRFWFEPLKFASRESLLPNGTSQHGPPVKTVVSSSNGQDIRTRHSMWEFLFQCRFYLVYHFKTSKQIAVQQHRCITSLDKAINEMDPEKWSSHAGFFSYSFGNYTLHNCKCSWTSLIVKLRVHGALIYWTTKTYWSKCKDIKTYCIWSDRNELPSELIICTLKRP